MAALLAGAFADDPAFGWIFPDPADRARRLPRLLALMIASDAQAGMALAGGTAAALWRGPGRAKVGWGEMLRRAVPLVAALGGGVRRALRVGDAIDAHLPAGDFWYLHMLGCDPACQRRGHAGAVLEAGLARIGGRLPVYAETANDANLPFYARHGFHVTAEWQVKDGPRFWSLTREG